jgi:hypothetical protein
MKTANKKAGVRQNKPASPGHLRKVTGKPEEVAKTIHRALTKTPQRKALIVFDTLR